MVGGNPLIQFGAYLLTGFSLPSNVEGSQILAAGWINDMFEGAETCSETSCFYADPGETITIQTGFGMARGLVQPEPGVLDTLAREVTAAVFRLLGNINFATCAAEPSAPQIQETGFLGKCPPQTRRYLLTERLGRASLLGSMCARVKDASQRPG